MCLYYHRTNVIYNHVGWRLTGDTLNSYWYQEIRSSGSLTHKLPKWSGVSTHFRLLKSSPWNNPIFMRLTIAQLLPWWWDSDLWSPTCIPAALTTKLRKWGISNLLIWDTGFGKRILFPKINRRHCQPSTGSNSNFRLLKSYSWKISNYYDYSNDPNFICCVAGSGGEIDGGTAKQMAQWGAKLALIDIHEGRLNEVLALCAEIGLPSENIYSVVGDVMKQEVGTSFVEGTVQTFGTVNFLVSVYLMWKLNIGLIA